MTDFFRDDTEVAPAPSSGYGEGGYAPVSVTRKMLYCKVLRLSLGSVHPHGSVLSLDEQLCVRLRPATWQGKQDSLNALLPLKERSTIHWHRPLNRQCRALLILLDPHYLSSLPDNLSPFITMKASLKWEIVFVMTGFRRKGGSIFCNW